MCTRTIRSYTYNAAVGLWGVKMTWKQPLHCQLSSKTNFAKTLFLKVRKQKKLGLY